MAFTNPFTAVVGATILASGWNTSGRDNINALWVYTAAGDIAYATSPATLARLGKPAVDSFLYNTAAGVPSWLASTLIGGIHAKGIVSFNPTQTFTTTWTDITGATVTLTLTATCTIIVLASIVGYQATVGNVFTVRAVVDGTADSNAGEVFNGGDSAARNEALPYFYYATGIPSGDRVVKMQSEKQGTNNYVAQGRLVALAFAE